MTTNLTFDDCLNIFVALKCELKDWKVLAESQYASPANKERALIKVKQIESTIEKINSIMDTL